LLSSDKGNAHRLWEIAQLLLKSNRERKTIGKDLIFWQVTTETVNLLHTKIQGNMKQLNINEINIY